jgi:homoserine dehydrogenase
VAGVFGENDISILSMEQEGLGSGARIALITHRGQERNLRATLHGLGQLDVVTEIHGFLRVVGE